MRILHLNNTANVAWRLAQAQRRLGHDARVASFGRLPYGFPSDIRLPTINPRGVGPFMFHLDLLARWPFLRRFDVLHVHMGFAKNQWPFYLVYKRSSSGRVLVAHLHGQDVRRGYGLYNLDLADLLFVSTPDLLRLLPTAIWIPNPIELVPPSLPPGHARPRFGHFPSNPNLKGTQAIVATFEDAFGSVAERSEGFVRRYVTDEAELIVATNVPQDEVLRLMRDCDAVIDWHSREFPIYGNVSIEAMALGKPVFCTINPEFYDRCPALPVDASWFRRVASDPELRRTKGEEGREYVARVHAAEVVARSVEAAYLSVLTGKRTEAA